MVLDNPENDALPRRSSSKPTHDVVLAMLVVDGIGSGVDPLPDSDFVV